MTDLEREELVLHLKGYKIDVYKTSSMYYAFISEVNNSRIICNGSSEDKRVAIRLAIEKLNDLSNN